MHLSLWIFTITWIGSSSVSEEKCPPYQTDVICKRYIYNCSTDSDCPKSQICCTVKCGRECRPPKLNNKCPLVKCIGLPPGVCSRDTYTYMYMSLKKCKRCPEIFPCNKDCLLQKKVGPCDAKHPRYYYDVHYASCKKFNYGGCDGNANNFVTLKDCQKECNAGPIGTCLTVKCAPPPSDVCTEDVFIIMNGKICKGCPKIVPCKQVCGLPRRPGICKAYIPRYYYSTLSNSCRKFIYSGCNGNANNFATLNECLQKCDSNPNVCSLPKATGPFRMAIRMYYYDTTTKSCKTFIYGGGWGNANKFDTLEECQQICDVCNLPKKPGPCEALIPRYYYNVTTKSCEKFIYGGCQGNANNFETFDDCKQKCDNSYNVCELPMKIGPCYAAITRYFYNANTKSCQTFIYGGCERNANNFETLEDCKRKCDNSSIDPCSTAPKCAQPPPGICFEPTYKVIDGVKCHWCYKTVPCKPEV